MSRPITAILQRPVISEKSYTAMGEGRYVFRCHSGAGKIEIKRAIEEAFADQRISVVAVNTLNVKGKVRQRQRRRKRITGSTASWKKAIVTLAPGQKIEGVFENV